MIFLHKMQIILWLNCNQRVWIINYVGEHHLIVTAKSQKLLSSKFLDSTISNVVSHLMWYYLCTDSQLIFFLCSFSVKTLFNSYLYFAVIIILHPTDIYFNLKNAQHKSCELKFYSGSC